MNFRGYSIIACIVLCIMVWGSETSFSASKGTGRQGGFIIGYPSTMQTPDKQNAPVDSTYRQPDDGEAQDTMKSSAISSSVEIHDDIIAQLKKKLSIKDKKIQVLEERLARVHEKLTQKEIEFNMMQPEQPEMYEVRRNDNLWKIAKKKEVYGDPYMWIKIYNSNMSKIENPDLIYPGQLFEIPK